MDSEKKKKHIHTERVSGRMKLKTQTEPKAIAAEYRKCSDYKASLGQNGLYEQARRNERFYVGDQWYGAKCGNERPLVRRNIIKRIGEYKMSAVAASPISVNYSAEGIPNNTDIKDDARKIKNEMYENGKAPGGNPEAPEISVITQAMSNYFGVTAERVKLDAKKEQLLRDAYITGTGVLFTYWDSEINTGLYADEGRKKQIKGDIACEVLNIENVAFGDPNNSDVQSQPFIIIAQRRDVEDVKREARRNRQNDGEIIPDRDEQYLQTYNDNGEPAESRRVTVYTKIFKEWNETDEAYNVMAVRVTEKAVVRKPWCLKLTRYPIATFVWESRSNSIYGESEVTYLIPNQIAVNRALTSAVWGLMKNGMPIMIVNGDVVPQAVTNDPGQIIKVFGSAEETAGAVRYVQPPQVTTQFQNLVNDLCSSTLSDSGANDAALGNIRPDNATAIIQMREAALQPMQLYMNRFYDFIEDVARIWADFWVNLYGNRSLKISDRNGTRYFPFNAERYKNLIFTAKIDVGAATIYSEAVVISTLDNLLNAGLITFEQYLERLPSGVIPDVTGLREELNTQQAETYDTDTSNDELLAALQQQHPEEYEKFKRLPQAQQVQLLEQLKNGTAQQVGDMQTQEVGGL